MTVRQGEQRLALRDHLEIEARLAQTPGLDRVRRVRDHGMSRKSARSLTTVSAPLPAAEVTISPNILVGK